MPKSTCSHVGPLSQVQCNGSSAMPFPSTFTTGSVPDPRTDNLKDQVPCVPFHVLSSSLVKFISACFTRNLEALDACWCLLGNEIFVGSHASLFLSPHLVPFHLVYDISCFADLFHIIHIHHLLRAVAPCHSFYSRGALSTASPTNTTNTGFGRRGEVRN